MTITSSEWSLICQALREKAEADRDRAKGFVLSRTSIQFQAQALTAEKLAERIEQEEGC